MEILDKIQKFLQKSSSRYSNEISKQISDLESYNGNFWTEQVKKDYRRTNKRKFCLHFSDWSTLANAIVSPYSNSPWHIQINNDVFGLQDTVNKIESDNDLKKTLRGALERAVVCGAGYAVVTTVLKHGVPSIEIELVKKQSTVAIDPNCEKVDCSDAREGAIVNYISLDEAKEKYGDDVVPYGYPQVQPALNFTTIEQWPFLEDKIQEVYYYRKNKDGYVDFYKVCGTKVVEEITLPINYIPIIRFAGYEKYTTDGIKYSGIVDKTWTLQLGLNIAYSTLQERANRSIKANIIASRGAIKNLDEYYKKKENEDGSIIVYNDGFPAPTTIEEHFQTSDLQSMIQTTRETIADVIGIPLAGVLGNEDKTATEILIQQNNKESNVAVFYDNAYLATRTIGRIVLELLSNGEDIEFNLENGPDIITTNLKHRQELNLIASMLPQDLQSLVAVKLCDTVDSQFIDGLKNDIIANMDERIKLVSEQATDPVAIHQMNQMKSLVDQYSQTNDILQKQLEEQKQQIATLSIALQNQKESHLVDLAKHADNVDLKKAELELKAEQQGVDIQLDIAKTQNELADKTLEIEEKKIDIVKDLL